MSPNDIVSSSSFFIMVITQKGVQELMGILNFYAGGDTRQPEARSRLGNAYVITHKEIDETSGGSCKIDRERERQNTKSVDMDSQ